MSEIRNKFILEENMERQSAESLAERAIKFGQVARDGNVVIHDTSLSKGDQLKLALVVRYIGNCLDESISKTVRPSELTKSLGQRIEAIGSSLSKLSAEGFAKKEGYGEYAVLPYRVDAFLTHIEKDDGDQTETGKRAKKKQRSSSGHSSGRSSGAGKDLQQLIDDGFFETPKLMSDVIKKLRQENSFHDPRVVDKVMRETYMSSKRILKRIPNDGTGNAKWLYVIRK